MLPWRAGERILRCWWPSWRSPPSGSSYKLYIRVPLKSGKQCLGTTALKNPFAHERGSFSFYAPLLKVTTPLTIISQAAAFYQGEPTKRRRLLLQFWKDPSNFSISATTRLPSPDLFFCHGELGLHLSAPYSCWALVYMYTYFSSEQQRTVHGVCMWLMILCRELKISGKCFALTGRHRNLIWGGNRILIPVMRKMPVGRSGWKCGFTIRRRSD